MHHPEVLNMYPHLLAPCTTQQEKMWVEHQAGFPVVVSSDGSSTSNPGIVPECDVDIDASSQIPADQDDPDSNLKGKM